VQQSREHQVPASVEIFLVEDNPADILLFKRILRMTCLAHGLTISSDGTDALERLENRGGGRPYRPDVIFLDLNLPGKPGAEVLATLKADPLLASIPVAVLTGSDNPDDPATCSSLGAALFLNKPVFFEQFSVLASAIERFVTEALSAKRSEPEAQLQAVAAGQILTAPGTCSPAAPLRRT